jgi:hypothetical protein
MTTQNDTNNLRSWLCRVALGGADRLAAYGEGALPAPAAARVERHLRACSACREELAALRAVSALLLARRPAAPAPSRDLWQRIQAEIETVPAPITVRPRRPVFLAPTLGAAAMAALAAVAVLSSSRPNAEKMSQSAPSVNNGGGAPPLARVTPDFGGESSALTFGAEAGLHVAQAASALPGKPSPRRANASSFFVPDKKSAPVRSASARQSRNNFSAAPDPFRRLQNRNDQTDYVAKNNRRRVRSVVVPSASPQIPDRWENEPAPRSDAPLDEMGGSATNTVTPLAPNNEEPSTRVASSTAAAIPAEVPAAEDPSGPSPTLTAARGVAAGESAVARYLSDNRRSGLFRYASSQAVSAPPDELR